MEFTDRCLLFRAELPANWRALSERRIERANFLLGELIPDDMEQTRVIQPRGDDSMKIDRIR